MSTPDRKPRRCPNCNGWMDRIEPTNLALRYKWDEDEWVLVGEEQFCNEAGRYQCPKCQGADG